MVLALFASHIRHFNISPRGVHVWRQCNSLAVASNFYEEDMDIMHPRVDHRRSSDGVTGMNFPLFEFTLAVVYKITGSESWLIGRSFQFLLAILTLYGFLLLGKELKLGSFPSVIACFALCW